MGSRKKGKCKCKFTHEEDKHLISLVSQYGDDWEKISAKMPTRNARQVRDRYMNYLAPDINTAPFTPEEDELILKKMKEIGPRWLFMKTFFKGRSEIALKNRCLIVEKKYQLRVSLNDIKDTEDEEDQTNNVKEKCLSVIKPEEMLYFWNEVLSDYKVLNLDSVSFFEYSFPV